MNRWEIEHAKERHARHPVLSQATTLLYDLMTLTNRVSDGWHYWHKPDRASRQLQRLIQRGDERVYGHFNVPDVTAAELRKALGPIKALMTREAATFAGSTLTFPS